MLTIENTQNTVIIACDGQPLLRYQAVTPASKPHFDFVALPPTAAARAGENIVLAAPHDRVWHLGLYFSPGVIDGVDFRDSERRASRGERHGVCRGHGPVQTLVRNDGAVAFSHEIRWQTSDGENWLSEQREILVHPPAGDFYRIDWKMTWTPIGGPRVWAAQDSGEVGGLIFGTLRSMADGAVFTSSGERTLEAVNRSNTRWCDYTGRLDGKLDMMNPDTAGVTLFHGGYPRNYSNAWHAMTQPFGLLAAGLEYEDIWFIRPGEAFDFRYGILVHAGDPDRERIESEYWNFQRCIPCPCCGYYGITDTYDICSFCSWEHDPVQSDDIDYKSGANQMSLREAQHSFLSIGAKDERSVQDSSKPTADDYRDPAWRPLD